VNAGDIGGLIITWNEAANIERCLQNLNWLTEIIVLDSGSTDGTIEMARRFPNVKTVHRAFDDLARQRNFGLEQLSTPWALCMDADYICPVALGSEIRDLPETPFVYQAEFRYVVYGVPLRATLYPSKPVLFRTNEFRFTQDGHKERLETGNADIRTLKTVIDHDDRKTLSRWLRSQLSYAEQEAQKLLHHETNGLDWKDRVRMWVLIAPILTVPYCLFWKLLILDGWFGALYTLQRVFAELLLSLEILDRRLRNAVIRSPDALQRPLGKDAEK
jgi:glycosyltransferase involved in cell wall biosynthesis